MLFGFGLITLSASIFAKWYLERKRWNGESAQYNGQPYRHDYIRGKYNDKLLVGIDFHKGIECTFRRENCLDRLFKLLGLTKEHQSGNPEFDQLVYVISDNTAVQSLVTSSNSLAINVLKLLHSDQHGATFVALKARNGRLWVEYKLKGELRANVGKDGIASFAVKALHGIAQEFIHFSGKHRSRWFDRYYWIGAIFSTLAYGLLLGGVVHFAIQGIEDEVLIPGTGIQTLAKTVAIAGAAILVTIAAILLGRTSRAHYVLLEVLLAGGMGLYITAYTNLRDFNIDQDKSAATVIQTEITYREIKKRRSRDKKRYFVTIRATEKTPEMELQVNEGFYEKASYRTPVLIDLHHGQLGFPWLTNLRIRPLSDSTAP